jgi:pyruvate/2-oxoglutarate dehydrogenase complex dihydrolipoamide dehydrogenase (E3) component
VAFNGGLSKPRRSFTVGHALPRKILFIGGGYIAFEFAHVAALAGSQVTVLRRGSRPLALFDPDLGYRYANPGNQANDIRDASQALHLRPAGSLVSWWSQH